MASDRLKGYNYGYIYGLGNAFCGVAIDKLIKNEYAKDLLFEIFKSLSGNSEDKPYISDIFNANLDISEVVDCKEVCQ